MVTETEIKPGVGAEPVQPLQEAPAGAEAATEEAKAEAAPKEPDYKAQLAEEKAARQRLEHKVSTLEGIARTNMSAQEVLERLERSQRITAIAAATGVTADELKAQYATLDNEARTATEKRAQYAAYQAEEAQLSAEVYESFRDKAGKLLADPNTSEEGKGVRALWAEGQALEESGQYREALHKKEQAARLSKDVGRKLEVKASDKAEQDAKAAQRKAEQSLRKERGELDMEADTGAAATGDERSLSALSQKDINRMSPQGG